LVPVDQTPGPGQIRNSNAHTLVSLLRECGAEPVDRGIVSDDILALEDAIHAALQAGADAIVTSGGVSAGDRDFIRDLVQRRAEPGHIFRIAMRPGKPLAFGLFEGRPLFGLPGNPASALVAFEIFVRPALRKMRGETPIVPATFPVRIPFQYRYRGGRTFLLRARVEPDFERGGYSLVPPGPQDSSFLASMATNNVLVILPGDRDRIEPDEVLPAIWLASALESR
ncbi:MAG TPA: molybdopterin molybdotransferase MoeA, partial [Planctomycetota bacterium]|nr:molybdopterin molybdotransferase MoeA [Planctomycetota bacterium]